MDNDVVVGVNGVENRHDAFFTAQRLALGGEQDVHAHSLACFVLQQQVHPVLLNWTESDRRDVSGLVDERCSE